MPRTGVFAGFWIIPMGCLEKEVHIEIKQKTGTELLGTNANLLGNNAFFGLNIHPMGC
jgi:hypothetical protein